MYRSDYPYIMKSGKREEKSPLSEALNRLGIQLFMYAYYTALPLIALVVLHWIVSSFVSFYYDEYWMDPLLLVLATFLGGAFMRQTAEDTDNGMGQLLIAILALVTFAYITKMDLDSIGAVYSAQFLPHILRSSVYNFVYAIPFIGMVGIIFFKHFSLKNYG